MDARAVALQGVGYSPLALALQGFWGVVPDEVVAQLLLDSWTASVTPWVSVASYELGFSCNHVDLMSHVSDVVLVGSTVQLSLELLVEETEEEP